MNAITSVTERLRRIFCAGPRDVIVMADEVLDLSRDHSLRIEFRDGRCHVRPLECEPVEAIVAAIPKSAVRALIDRIGTLCGSDSPYGGAIVLPDPGGALSVSFANTPDEQWIELSRISVQQLDELERRKQRLAQTPESGRPWETVKSRILERREG